MGSSAEGRESATAAPGEASSTGRESPRTIRFPLGLPGFPHVTRFSLQQLSHHAGPFLVMRSEEDPTVRFLVLPCADEALPLDRGELESACDLHGLSRAQVTVLLVVSGQPDAPAGVGHGLCANRRAPILLDTGRAIGIQHVLDNPDYAVRWPLALAA